MSCCVLVLSNTGDCPPAAPLIAFIIIIEAIEVTTGGVHTSLPPMPSCDECEWFDIVLLGRDGGRIREPALDDPTSPSFEAPPETGDGNGGNTIEPVVVGVPGADPVPDRNPSLLALPPESMPGDARPAEGNILPSELFDLLCRDPSLPNIFWTMFGRSGCSAAPLPSPDGPE
uniref:Uncharacterized protein n=1 Tax=Anopheles maculatus TaxID=74869 RepID=A0A182SS80_9DIPT